MIGRVRLREFGLLTTLFCGCRRAPAFNVLGSFFPGWILCIIAGIVGAVILGAILYSTGIEQQIKSIPLLYVSVSIFLACTFWLLIFE